MHPFFPAIPLHSLSPFLPPSLTQHIVAIHWAPSLQLMKTVQGPPLYQPLLWSLYHTGVETTQDQLFSGRHV